jgi:hypothetical protein
MNIGPNHEANLKDPEPSPMEESRQAWEAPRIIDLSIAMETKLVVGVGADLVIIGPEAS